MRKKGTVYLVGAGCGRYDLITVRGMEILQKCDAVVYDSLIDERLLMFVPPYAEKICVGKRAGHHSEQQERINEILIEKADEGKMTVRLKGGDPFVFGRGGEEISALRENGIEYSIVPGVTSAVAGAELSGIPVTHRRMSRSFHVITGHTADGNDKERMRKYAQLDGTLVFLMGLENLHNITEQLISGGMSPDTPAAVISSADRSDSRTVRAKLSEIEKKATDEKIKPPAIIVVGDTAALDFSPTEELPLKGISVSVTGTSHFTQKIGGELNRLGAEVDFPCPLEVHEYNENTAFDDSLSRIEEYSWIVLTSANGVDIFVKRMRKLHIDIRRLSGIKVAVIGRGTAAELEKYGIYAELIPDKFTSAVLGRELAEHTAIGERVLILRAEKGSPSLTEELDRGGISYDDIKIYDVAAGNRGECGREITSDYLVFGSASGTDAFFGGGYTVSPHTKIVCIGEITALALERHGIGDYITAGKQDIGGIIETIIRTEINF
jgi:uroporphyrinogen III methyltransferase/synthase